jgi:multidrug efflux pump subunit AcrB
VKAFTNFSVNSPEVFVDIDRAKFKALGVTVNDVFTTPQAYMGSSHVNLFNKFNLSFQVRSQQTRTTVPMPGTFPICT